MRFGFIGAGNMASAIIRGMTIGTRSYDGKDIFITSKSGTSAHPKQRVMPFVLKA